MSTEINKEGNPATDQITRRDAIKGIGLGAGVIASLPVLSSGASAQEIAHNHNHAAAPATESKPVALRFFTEDENRTVIEMSERIIPEDSHSPGAKAAKVNEYLDLIISESPELTKQNWREGLAAINKMSRDKFGKAFADASVEQQVQLLTEISKNERTPTTTEERFFRTIKYGTIDGYYTSEIGIHKELQYKGNSYLKEFTGCTHPEHQS
ncbi:MAG TPA: gluconate 2-dehydrogenase subunit 3 family protein [Blastocatellia bacterium]|nr:gluconate 2-dehydrogenase subunit 3 family protein [Blastocatellia bacterium]